VNRRLVIRVGEPGNTPRYNWLDWMWLRNKTLYSVRHAAVTPAIFAKQEARDLLSRSGKR
jgi:hypothetical protein